jgi:hypothetical protein
LAESQSHLIQLALNDQLSLFKYREDVVECAIKQLHDRKLAINFLLNDQMVKMYDSINETVTAEDLHCCQMETSYLRQNNEIVIILHASCINVKYLTIY